MSYGSNGAQFRSKRHLRHPVEVSLISASGCLRFISVIEHGGPIHADAVHRGDGDAGTERPHPVELFGQELNPESFAICKSDMLVTGHDPENIAFGNTLTADVLIATEI
jgi:hypothetical protein